MKDNYRNPILLLLFLGLLIRMGLLSARSIWYDEAFSLLIVEQTFPDMIHGLRADVHPPLYYILLWLWQRLLPGGVFSARLFSVLAGTAAVGFAYLIGREIFKPAAAVVGLGLLSISPFQVHYAQEIRMYSLLAVFQIGATYCLIKALQEGRAAWWVGFAITAAAAQYTHNLAFLFLIPLSLTPLFWGRPQAFRSLLVSAAGSLMLYAPWLTVTLGQFSDMAGQYWISKPGFARFLTVLITYTANLPLDEGWLPVVFFCSLVVVFLGIARVFASSGETKGPIQVHYWLIWMAFGPVFLAFAISQWMPIFIERSFLSSGVIFLLWAAWLLTGDDLHRGAAGISGLLLLIAAGVGLWTHFTYQGFPYGPYREMGRYLAAHKQENEQIIHANKLTGLPLYYFDRKLPQTYVADPPGSARDTFSETTQAVIGFKGAKTIAKAAEGAEVVWWIVFEKELSEYQESGQPVHPQQVWLDEHYKLVEFREWQTLNIYLYQN
jgi:uncharacterized membrane protein